MVSKSLSSTEIKALWNHFDRNKDGVITKDEFADFISLNLSRLYSVPRPLPPALVDEAFGLIDTNSGGFINFEEFRANINKYWDNKEALLKKYVPNAVPGHASGSAISSGGSGFGASGAGASGAGDAASGAAAAALQAAESSAKAALARVAELESEIAALRAEIARLRAQLGERDAEIASLKQQLDKGTHSQTGEVARLHAELAEARLVRESLALEQQTTQRMLEDFRRQFAALEAARKAEEEELERLRRENAKMGERSAIANRSIEDERNRLAEENAMLQVKLRQAESALANERERQRDRDEKLFSMQDLHRKFLALETEFATERQRFMNYRALLKEKWRAEERKILFIMENPKFRAQHAASLETARQSCEHLLHEIESLWNSPKRFFPDVLGHRHGSISAQRPKSPLRSPREAGQKPRARSPPFLPPGPTTARVPGGLARPGHPGHLLM